MINVKASGSGCACQSHVCPLFMPPYVIHCSCLQAMRENRVMREQQYAERREKDWELTLMREAELHRSMKAQVSVCGQQGVGPAFW